MSIETLRATIAAKNREIAELRAQLQRRDVAITQAQGLATAWRSYDADYDSAEIFKDCANAIDAALTAAQSGETK